VLGHGRWPIVRLRPLVATLIESAPHSSSLRRSSRPERIREGGAAHRLCPAAGGCGNQAGSQPAPKGLCANRNGPRRPTSFASRPLCCHTESPTGNARRSTGGRMSTPQRRSRRTWAGPAGGDSGCRAGDDPGDASLNAAPSMPATLLAWTATSCSLLGERCL
jgi:hypothetical protein